MWNLKYGHMVGVGGIGMMGSWGHYGTGQMTRGPEPLAEMPVSPQEAIQATQAYLDVYLPGTQAATEAHPVYDYDSIHIMRGGKTVGMVSVNGYTLEVFPTSGTASSSPWPRKTRRDRTPAPAENPHW
jgi:hypothetical protein